MYEALNNGVAVVMAVLAAAAGAAYSTMRVVRTWSVTKRDTVVNAVEANLYERLNEQIATSLARAQAADGRANEAQDRLHTVEQRLKLLERAEAANVRMRRQIETKDTEIVTLRRVVKERNVTIREQNGRIEKLEKAVVDLNARVTKDEEKFTASVVKPRSKRLRTRKGEAGHDT